MGGLRLLVLVVELSVYWKGYPHSDGLLSESCYLLVLSYRAAEMTE